MAALASAGRLGLEAQIPAPVSRQQRGHVQHSGLHADARQPRRAPLLQLPGRSLRGLTARCPGGWAAPPVRTAPHPARQRGAKACQARSAPALSSEAARAPPAHCPEAPGERCPCACLGRRWGRAGSSYLEDEGWSSVFRLRPQRPPPPIKGKKSAYSHLIPRPGRSRYPPEEGHRLSPDNACGNVV